MTYYENDEDLFNYNPEEELTSSTNPSESSENDSFDFQFKDEHFQFFKAKTAVSFLQAQGLWFDESHVKTSSGNKAVHMILDEITQGRFTLLKNYFQTEMALYRKKDILYLTSKFMNILSSSDMEHISINVEGSSIKLDMAIISMFINNNLNIINHSLSVLRALYVHLGEKLNIEIDPSLLENHPLTSDDPEEDIPNFDETFGHLFSKSYPCDYSNFLNNLHSNLYEVFKHEDFVEKVRYFTSFNGEIEIC